MQTFNLGNKVRDKFTGFEGWVHATAFYITGCDQCLVNQRTLDDKGQPKDGVWLDNTRLEIVAVGKPVETTPRGGPSAGEAAGLRSA